MSRTTPGSVWAGGTGQPWNPMTKPAASPRPSETAASWTARRTGVAGGAGVGVATCGGVFQMGWRGLTRTGYNGLMTQLDAFLQALLDDPLDLTPRLIFADWLEDRGDPRGAKLRLPPELGRASWVCHAYRADVELMAEQRGGWGPRCNRVEFTFPGAWHGEHRYFREDRHNFPLSISIELLRLPPRDHDCLHLMDIGPNSHGELVPGLNPMAIPLPLGFAVQIAGRRGKATVSVSVTDVSGERLAIISKLLTEADATEGWLRGLFPELSAKPSPSPSPA